MLYFDHNRYCKTDNGIYCIKKNGAAANRYYLLFMNDHGEQTLCENKSSLYCEQYALDHHNKMEAGKLPNKVIIPGLYYCDLDNNVFPCEVVSNPRVNTECIQLRDSKGPVNKEVIILQVFKDKDTRYLYVITDNNRDERILVRNGWLIRRKH